MEILIKVLEYSESANYIFLFILYFIEGPVSNILSAMVAAKGFLNIWYIFLLASTAELLADIMYFLLGKYASRGWVEKIFNKAERLEFFKLIDKYIDSNTTPTLFLLKATPGLAIPALIYIGRNKISFKKFLINLFPISVLRNVIMSIMGYYTIISVENIYKYYGLSHTLVYISIILAILIIIFMERKKIRTLLNKKVLKAIKK